MHRIFQAAIAAKIMEEFLQKDVLLLLQPGYHVLLVDNASIHRSPTIIQLCRDFGIHLEYLRPYLPEYNPVERKKCGLPNVDGDDDDDDDDNV
jgi:transposase